MLTVYHSNRMELLGDLLATLLQNPLESPFETEQVVVQQAGMARWLQIYLTERNGVAANMVFPLPARFVWQVIAGQRAGIPDRDPLDRDTLRWAILGILPDLRDDPELEHYLSTDISGTRSWHLAAKIAEVIDQYLVFRPEWISRWENGEQQHWQARLWRALAKQVPMHRVSALQQFLSDWQAGRRTPEKLPSRVSIFGISALPPVYLRILRALAEEIPVHILFHNPCQYYWADVVPEKQRSRVLRRLPESSRVHAGALLESGNPLLASMGTQGRDFLHWLYSDTVDHEAEAFLDPSEQPHAGLLQHLQSDILHMRAGRDKTHPGTIDKDDRSISVHVCHGALRECQILLDQLLLLFSRDPQLRPRDVVIMVPDIDTYAPFIEAVFGSQQPFRVPWSIADRSPSQEHPLIILTTRLLSLPETRFSCSEVLALLEIPALADRFSIDPDGLERIRNALLEAGVNWGLDAEDKTTSVGAPATHQNTWAFGRERLLTGYALPDDEPRLFAGIAPVAGVGPQDAEVLGALWELLDLLRTFRDRMRTPKPPRQWQQLLDEMLDTLLRVNADEEAVVQMIRDATADLVETAANAGFHNEIGLEVFRDGLLRDLGQPRSGNSYLAGSVTFCALQPMRSIPFRVVWLMGMSEAGFPRRGQRPDFDLMAHSPQRGDRSHRDDQRYLFLEAVLSAREHLGISYIGRDARDNAERQPSVLLGELLDYVDENYRMEAGRVSTGITTHHALQPFNPRYFVAGTSTPGFSTFWCDVSRKRQQPAERHHFAPQPIPEGAPEANETRLDIIDLTRFFSHPCRYFFKRCLGVTLATIDNQPADQEPFALAGLQRYQCREQVVRSVIRGQDMASAGAYLRAQGALPHAAMGELSVAALSSSVQPLLERLADCAGEPMAVEVDIKLEVDGAPTHVVGWLPNYLTEHGLVCHRVGRLRGQEWISLWIQHLALSLTDDLPGPCRSRWMTLDDDLYFSEPVPAEQARGHLTELCRLRREGLLQPLAFFPDTALAYVQALHSEHKDPLSMALKQWQPAFNSQVPRESEDPYIARAFGSFEDPLTQTGFKRLASTILEPVLSAVQASSEAAQS